MKLLRFTLVSEGSSDRALIPILVWTIHQHASATIDPQWAELRKLPRPPTRLSEKIKTSLELYPCDLLFVHRDADREDRGNRVREIRDVLERLENPPAVCVVPVRMLEAWLMFDEQAIRRAAGNPNGKSQLKLPPSGKVEEIADPKQVLKEIFRSASEFMGRRRRRIETSSAVHRIAELVDDFSPLRRLSAFKAFEEDLRRTLQVLLP